MKMRSVLSALAVASAAVALTVSFAAPASAMHESPAPVGDMAPSYSGHYSTPDTGLRGAARPWEAGPAWNR